MVIVSACLAGLNCRYDGKSRPDERIRKLVAQGKAVPVCPEQLGGCATPRPAAEIRGGTGADVLDGSARVVRSDGKDVTGEFIRGAREVLAVAKLTGAENAVLKARSPSCGCGGIYDGSFSGRLVNGNGVTAELLLRNGIKVADEENDCRAGAK